MGSLSAAIDVVTAAVVAFVTFGKDGIALRRLDAGALANNGQFSMHDSLTRSFYLDVLAEILLINVAESKKKKKKRARLSRKVAFILVSKRVAVRLAIG